MDRPTDRLATALAFAGALLGPLVLLMFLLIVAEGWSPDGLVIDILRYEIGMSERIVEVSAALGALLFLGWGLQLLICVVKFANVAHRQLPGGWLCPALTLYLGMICAAIIPRLEVLSATRSEGTILTMLILMLIPGGAFALSVALWCRIFFVRRVLGMGEPDRLRMVGAEGFEPSTPPL
jgi:hypothetical protein